MNIKEHIEAGHYPKDAKSRALVPMRSGSVAVIYATDHDCPEEPISGSFGGYATSWNEEGFYYAPQQGPNDLLLPTPRVVPVVRYLVRSPAGDVGLFDKRELAEMTARQCNYSIIELKGEETQSWE